MGSVAEFIRAARGRRTSLQGEVAYIRAFDLAYDMKRQRVPRLLGQTVQDYAVGPSKPGPKQGFFYRPQMVVLPPTIYPGSLGPLEVSMTVKIFNVGAVSIRVRTPFEASSLAELVGYYGLSLTDRSMEAEVIQVAEQVRRELEPHLVRPVPALGAGEDYTVFCLYQLPATEREHRSAEAWLRENRRAVAALLTQEQDASRLSDQEAAESTDRCHLLHQDWLNLWMVILETTIVLLFVIDVLLVLMG
jgi:hypothetical protein